MKKFQLQIPIPCHEDPSKMDVVSNGRFCHACSKTVIDFSSMTDSQVINFFKNYKGGNVCGSLADDQLSRDFIEPRKPMPWVKYFFTVAIPAFLLSLKSTAQKKSGEVVVTILKVRAQGELIGYATTSVSGRISDREGNPIPFASVMDKEGSNGVSADSNGVYNIVVKPGTQLNFSSIGFKDTMVTAHSNVADVILDEDEAMKEVVVSAIGIRRKGMITGGAMTIITTQQSFMDTIKNWFSPPPSHKVYPNPVSRGTSVTVQLPEVQEGNYEIEWLSVSGSLIEKKTVWLDAQGKVFDVDVPAVNAGTYFLRVRNQVGKGFTHKVVVR